MSLFPIPKLADLLEDPGKASSLPAEAIPELRGQLAKLDTILLSRLLGANSNGNGGGQGETQTGGDLLKAEQAAEILSVTPRWLYRHSGKLPFARRLSRKVLRFSESGLRKWRAAKKA